MNLTENDFEQLGCWQDVTDEENIIVFGMDFPSLNSYFFITDSDGKTPIDSSDFLLIAAYDDNNCFLWGKELLNFEALHTLVAEHSSSTPELFNSIFNYSLPKK